MNLKDVKLGLELTQTNTVQWFCHEQRDVSKHSMMLTKYTDIYTIQSPLS